MSKSIRRRLQAWYALVLLATIGGFAVILYVRARTAKFEQIDTRLQSAALVLDATLRSRPPNLIDPNRLDPMRGPRDGKGKGPPPGGRDEHKSKGRPPGEWGPTPIESLERMHALGEKGPPPGARDRGPPRPPPERWIQEMSLPAVLQGRDGEQSYAFAVWRPDKKLLRSAGWANDQLPLAPPEDVSNQVTIHARDNLREARLKGPFQSIILVARPVDKELAELAAFAWQLLAAGTGVMAIGLLGGWLVSNQMFRPIAAMSKTASAISETNLSERIETKNIDIELVNLAQVLNAAFDRLEIAFERQTQFTADASHELRTPLAVIRSSVELALSRPRSQEQYRETLVSCLRAVKRMTGITDGLLTLARADANQHSMIHGAIALDHVVTDTVTLLTPLAADRGVDLKADIKPVQVMGDSVALGRVVSNLISNAVQYNKPGGEVRISLTNDDDVAVLKIADTGIGILPSELPHIFDRFYRVDKARSRAVGGAGLGLAICQELITALGGTIDAKSELDHGTTFEVRLPVHGENAAHLFTNGSVKPG